MDLRIELGERGCILNARQEAIVHVLDVLPQ